MSHVGPESVKNRGENTENSARLMLRVRRRNRIFRKKFSVQVESKGLVEVAYVLATGLVANTHVTGHPDVIRDEFP